MAVVGNVYRCSVVFQQAGVTADPGGTVTFTYRSPDGRETRYVFGVDAQVVKDGPGLYHVDVPCPLAGYYVANFTAGTGAGQSADETTWVVAASAA